MIIRIIFLQLVFCISASAQQKVSEKENKEWVYFQNGIIQLGFNLDNGLFFLKNSQGKKIIDSAYFQAGGLQSKDSCKKRLWTVTNVKDEFGKGKMLTIKIAFENYADILWMVSLYDNKEFVVFNMGIDNDTHKIYRLMRFFPLIALRFTRVEIIQ